MNENRALSQSLKAILGLRDLIVGGAFAPGERLFEVPISERLDLSRTPVRAALSQLAQEGLLETVPGGGYAVRVFSIADVRDVIELRGLLEGTAARFAAERGASADVLAQMRAIVDRIDEIIAPGPDRMDFERYVGLNEQFHDLLHRACASPTIQRELDRVMHLPFASPSAFLQGQGDVPAFRMSLAVAQAQHRAMLDAIENRQGLRAEMIGREHARLAATNLDYVLTSDRSLLGKLPALALVHG